MEINKRVQEAAADPDEVLADTFAKRLPGVPGSSRTIRKNTSGDCPKCGTYNKQLIDSKYPKYDKYTDTVEKYFICDKCLTEWYETLELEYAGCAVREVTEDGIRMTKYDCDGGIEENE